MVDKQESILACQLRAVTFLGLGGRCHEVTRLSPLYSDRRDSLLSRVTATRLGQLTPSCPLPSC